MTFQEWKAQYAALKGLADDLRLQVVATARQTAREAHLDPQMPFLHAHNAVVSRDHGRPWPEVDYAKAEAVIALEQVSWEPHRLVDAWSKSVWPTVGR